MWQCCTSNNNAVVLVNGKKLHRKQSKNDENEDIVRMNFNGSSCRVDRTNAKETNKNVKNFQKDFKELIRGYKVKWNSKLIEMSQPRDALYSTETAHTSDGVRKSKILATKRLGEDLRLTSTTEYIDKKSNTSFNPYGSRSMPTEVRGITLRQLRAIVPLIKRRCEKEQWTRAVYKSGKKSDDVERVTLENATMYDVNEYIIKPFTKYSQKSFVETLPSTKGTQPPRWFVR